MSERDWTLAAMRWWHIDALLPLEEDLFGIEQWSAAMFWNELANGQHYLVAVDREGAILGYGGMTVQPGEAWVQNLGVRQDQQRHGIGRALLEALLGYAARQGVSKVLLEVAVDNEKAQRLYATHGFETVGRRRGYYQPSNKDALVMMRDA